MKSEHDGIPIYSTLKTDKLQLFMKTNYNDPYPYACNREEFVVGNCIRVISQYESGVLATSWWYI